MREEVWEHVGEPCILAVTGAQDFLEYDGSIVFATRYPGFTTPFVTVLRMVEDIVTFTKDEEVRIAAYPALRDLCVAYASDPPR